MKRLTRICYALAKEPPFRLISKGILRLLKVKSSTRSLWDISRRPQYLLGLITAAQQAKREGLAALSAVEFGVAGGYGLLSMQQDARAVSIETGIEIQIYGFDTGGGLPDLIGDYRDHPDIWCTGDFPMDHDKLRGRLGSSSTLVLGNVSQTVPKFFNSYNPPPLGFISIDLDLYSSARDALHIFQAPGRRMLRHTPMYFDDIDMIYTHSKGGELLAISDFNEGSTDVYIDQWRGVKSFRPFPEAPYLDRLYLAHDLAAISRVRQDRKASQLPI